MLKPDTIERDLVQTIIDELVDFGCVIESFNLTKPSSEVIKEHYSDVINRMNQRELFIERISNTFVNAQVIPMIIKSEKSIDEIRAFIGSTQPCKADDGTIRKKYGLEDNYDKADEEKRMVNNLIHCSDSLESCEREINLWFPKK
jgi:nucleoside-diphosphate kinase